MKQENCQQNGQTISSKLRDIVDGLVQRHNALKNSRPDMILREYVFQDGLEAVDEHRKAAYGRIDADLEAGRITSNEALRQKYNWDVQHGYCD